MQVSPNKAPIVYIDASVLKFSATALIRLFPRTQLIDWGNGLMSEHKYYDLGYLNPNETISNPILKREAELIESVARLVKAQRLVAVADIETHFESWGLPKMDGVKFYGAPIDLASSPTPSCRLLFCAGHDPEEMQHEFLSEIDHPRFLELQRITGGYQGKGRYCWNQMLDAFALWCAEDKSCDYFLTLDFKLIKQVERHRARGMKPMLVLPSELLSNF